MIDNDYASASSSTRTITGFFQSRSEADKAVDDLVATGIQRDAITLVAGRGDETATMAAEGETGGFWNGLKDLFLPEEDRYAYAEGLTRGGYMVSVRTRESEAPRVMDVLEQNGSADMDDLEASWKSEGWSGYTPGSMDDSIVGTRAKEKGWVDVAGIERTGTNETVSSSGLTGGTSGFVDTPSSTYARDTTIGSGVAASGVKASDTAGLAGTAASDHAGKDSDGVISVVEENLRIGKREVGHGRVKIRSYVVETPVSEQVSLRSEQVTIDRQAVDRPLTGAEDLFAERTIELDETSEEAVIAKEARVKEEISLNKTVENRTETVSDTVRHTEVEVDDKRVGGGDGATSRTEWSTETPKAASTETKTYRS